MHPTVTSLSCSEARVTSFIRWRVVNRGQCTKPAFLAGHYNARFTGSDVVCVRSRTRGPRAAVHVRAYTAKYRVSVRYAFCSRWGNSWLRDFARSFHPRVTVVTLSAIATLANSRNMLLRYWWNVPRGSARSFANIQYKHIKCTHVCIQYINIHILINYELQDMDLSKRLLSIWTSYYINIFLVHNMYVLFCKKNYLFEILLFLLSYII